LVIKKRTEVVSVWSFSDKKNNPRYQTILRRSNQVSPPLTAPV